MATASGMPEPSVESSVDLLLRARAGDDAALDTLLARYLPRLRRWASGRLPWGARTMVDTGDVVQDAVMAALKHLNTVELRGSGSIQAYLRQAVNNRLTDLYRRSARRPRREDLPEHAAATSTSPLEAAIGSEALRRYEEALSRLKEEDRQAVVLRIELGCDYTEIADELGKPSLPAARVAVSRALARLAAEMRRGH